jgi:hypothetical protein
MLLSVTGILLFNAGVKAQPYNRKLPVADNDNNGNISWCAYVPA